MSKLLVFLLMLSIAQVIHVESYNLTISPDHARITSDPQSVSFMCRADVPLTGCQFTWWDWKCNRDVSPLDLSQGNQSVEEPGTLDNDIIGYRYNGHGLEYGECGISMLLTGEKLWMVGCRVHAEDGGWKYAWADVYATSDERTALQDMASLTTPRETVVLPGNEARFAMKERRSVAKEPLSRCIFVLLRETFLYFDQGGECPDSTGRHSYLNTGPQSGDCGLMVANVSDADNGPVSCFVDTAVSPRTNAISAARFMALVVARPPSAPTLNLAYSATNVTASCQVTGSRPMAKMSWILGDEVIRQDEDDDSRANLQEGWRWPWMQGSLMQKVKLQLGPGNIGKSLKCRITHIALTQPLEATVMISS